MEMLLHQHFHFNLSISTVSQVRKHTHKSRVWSMQLPEFGHQSNYYPVKSPFKSALGLVGCVLHKMIAAAVYLLLAQCEER